MKHTAGQRGRPQLNPPLYTSSPLAGAFHTKHLRYFGGLPLYLQVPCRAVLPAASRCKGTKCQLVHDAPYYLMRPYTHRAWNQNVQCASCRGVATPGVSTFLRIASSAVTRRKGSRGKMSRNTKRMGTSMPGCHASPWKTRPSRRSCPSSWSWCASCFPIHPRHPCRQGKLRQQAQHSRLLSPRPYPVSQQASPSLTWAQPDIPEAAPGPLQLLPLPHTGQQPMPLPTSPPTSQVADGGSALRALTGQPWASPANTGFPASPASEGLTPAQVPGQLKGKIQRGEYVDLSELLACDFQYRYSGLDDSQALEVVDGKLSLAPRCKNRHLSNLQLWLRAWHIYEDTLLSFYPHRYMELSHYRRHISDLDQRFHWAAILSYDAQFRHKCAIHNLPLSAFDQQLYVTILDATATKAVARRCFRCQQYDHKVIDCPFPPGAPLEKEATVKKAVQSQQGRGNYRPQQQHPSSRGTGSQLPAVYHQGREICIKYQSASCTFPNCRRAHICRHCK